jgi:hypothetical protein
MRTLRAFLILLALLFAVPASAAGFDDLDLSRLNDLEPARRQARFNFVVRELTMGMTPAPNHAVAALGEYELEGGLETRLAFIHTGPADGEATSAWEDIVEDGDPTPIYFSPGLVLRKGLPYGFEVGGRANWILLTRQFVISGYGRAVPFGGWSKVPDIAIQWGYTGYVGNDQVQLGVFDLDITIGYTFKMSGTDEKRGTNFSPFGGYTFLLADASPGQVDLDLVDAVSGDASRAGAGVNPLDYQFHRILLGIDIGGGGAAFRISGDVNFPREGAVIGAVNIALTGTI